MIVNWIRLGEDTVTVGKIVCLGRNYRAHAQELGNPVPQEPVIFLKPSSSIIHDGDSIIIPPRSQDVHHEVELAVLIGKEARHVDRADAMDHVRGWGVLLDMTARDIQSRAKDKGLPWSVAKGFDTFCPVSDFVERNVVNDPANLSIRLEVNGEVRQDGSTAHMIFPVDFIIHYISHIMTLYPGDLIATGTPEGVARVDPGDRLLASVEGVGSLSVGVK